MSHEPFNEADLDAIVSWADGDHAGPRDPKALARLLVGDLRAARAELEWEHGEHLDVIRLLSERDTLRRRAEAELAIARAEIDRLTAERDAASTELDLTRKRATHWQSQHAEARRIIQQHKAKLTRAEAERDAATVAADGPLFEAHQSAAEIERLRTRVSEVEAQSSTHLRAQSRLLKLLAEREARLDAVKAVCARAEYFNRAGYAGMLDEVIAALNVAATGTEPEAGS